LRKKAQRIKKVARDLRARAKKRSTTVVQRPTATSRGHGRRVNAAVFAYGYAGPRSREGRTEGAEKR